MIVLQMSSTYVSMYFNTVRSCFKEIYHKVKKKKKQSKNNV